MEKIVESENNNVGVYISIPIEEQNLTVEEIDELEKACDDLFKFVADKLSLYLSAVLIAHDPLILSRALNYYNDAMNTAGSRLNKDLDIVKGYIK